MRVPDARALRGAHEPAALVDDAVGAGQAEPGAGALRLGGEERLEDAGQHLGRHAAARCLRPQARRSAPRCSMRFDRRVGLADERRAGRTTMRPPGGVASRAFSTRFMTTCSICARSPVTSGSRPRGASSKVRCSLSSRRSISASPSTTWFRSSGCRLAGSACGCRRAAAASAARPAPTTRRIASIDSRDGWSGSKSRSSSERVAEDAGQQVVEVVGDAAGEAPEALHALGLDADAPGSPGAPPRRGPRSTGVSQRALHHAARSSRP